MNDPEKTRENYMIAAKNAIPPLTDRLMEELGLDPDDERLWRAIGGTLTEAFMRGVNEGTAELAGNLVAAGLDLSLGVLPPVVPEEDEEE